MIRRIGGLNTKNGITWSQCRRQACAMAGQFWPHGPASKASRTAKASVGIFGPVDAAQRPCDRLSVYVPALNASTQTASPLLCPASEMVEAILDGW